MGETRARRRELVSIALALAGAVGVVVCLVHLGLWASGALVSALVLCAGAGGLVRRDERAEADTEGGEHRGE